MPSVHSFNLSAVLASEPDSEYPFIMNANTTIPLPTAGRSANFRWVQKEWSQLLRDYPDQWIAVDQGRVLAAGRNLGQVAQEARRASASADVIYEFIAGASLIF